MVENEISDRRQLLLRLAQVGGRALETELADHEARRERQRAGLGRAAQLVDVDELLVTAHGADSLDKSAWVRGGPELLEYGELCLGAITRIGASSPIAVRTVSDYPTS